MTDASSDADLQRHRDERELGAFGYAQELFRTIGGFSNFALSFSIISILTGAVTLYQHGLTMGGPAVQQFYYKDDHSPVYDYTLFDVDSPASCRRSIYRFIVRSVPDPLMESLDCPNPSLLTPKRNVTTTSLQALAILNDPFVLKQCEHFAALLEKAGSKEKQIEQAYRLALNRSPTPDESKKLSAFARKHGLANVCRLIFNTSEFMFVD